MLIAMWTVLALVGVAAILATVVAVRAREHRIVAIGLWAILIADLARLALIELALPLPRQEPLVSTMELLAAAADDGLHLVSAAVVAAIALRVLAQRGRGSTALVVIVWMVAIAVIALTYPVDEPDLSVRGEILRRKYLAAEIAAAFVSLLSVVHIARRRWRERPPAPSTLSERCAAVLAGGHFSLIVVGPHHFGLFGGAWVIAIAFNLGLFATIVALHGVALWIGQKR